MMMEELCIYIYDVYLMQPKLGNYRRLFIVVAEKKFGKYFPVIITTPMKEKFFKEVNEEEFIEAIKDVFSMAEVSEIVKRLYAESVGNDKYLKNV